MSRESYHFMVFLWKSILIAVAFSPLDSGKASKMLWELICPLVQLSTLSLAVKSKGLPKFCKTCSELVLSHSERTRRNLFHSPSLLITIVSNLVWTWLHLNSSMDDNVEHPLIGQKPVKDNSLDRISSKKQKIKFALFVIN